MTIEAHKVRIYEDAAGDYRWTAYDSNGEAIADSNEGYESKSYAARAAMDLFPRAIVKLEPEDEE